MTKTILFLGLCFFFVIPARANAADTVGTLESKLKNARGEEQLKIIVELADLYLEKNPEQAFSYGKKAQELLHRYPNPQTEATILNLLGKISYRKGEYQATIDYANKAGAISKKSGDKPNYASSLFNLGMAQKYLANYNKAIDYFTSAQAIYTELGDKINIASCLTQIGLVYRRVNDFSKALDYITQAGEIYIDIDEKKSIASVYNNIGLIYSDLGNYDLALQYFKKRIELPGLEISLESISITKANIASIYITQGKYDEAFKLVKEAHEGFEKLGSKKNLSNTVQTIGEIYEKKNDLKNALLYYSRAKKLKEETRESFGISSCLLSLGRTQRRLGHYPPAIDCLEEAITLSQKINNTNITMDANFELSTVYQEMGDYPKALEYYKKYKETNDLIFTEDNARKIAETQARFDLERKEKEITLLKKDQQIQSLNLARQKSIIHSSISISVLILILAFVMYTRYRLKIRVNKKLQEEIAMRIKTEEALVKSRKSETVAILSAGISHDFNNLLTIILGSLSMLKDSAHLFDAATTKFVDSAEKAANHAADLTRKFLTLSNADWTQPKKITLPGILKNIPSFSPEFKAINFDFDTSIPNDLKPVYGDEHQLTQLMGNLLLNAFEALNHDNTASKNPTGITPINVTAQNMMMENGYPWNLQPGEYVKISVKDRGKGIPPELMDKIFDPYFSTKQRGAQKGMGLGLAIAYAIIIKHKGHIEVSSELNQGTTVDLYIPAFND